MYEWNHLLTLQDSVTERLKKDQIQIKHFIVFMCHVQRRKYLCVEVAHASASLVSSLLSVAVTSKGRLPFLAQKLMLMSKEVREVLDRRILNSFSFGENVDFKITSHLKCVSV